MTQEIEEKLRDLKGVLGIKADRLRLAYLFETDPESKRALESTISVLHAQRFTDESILLLPPPADVAMGEYALGTIQYNGKNLYPFGLRERELPQHVIVAGRSGSGKSNTMLVLAKQFTEKRKPFLLFSFKREYRDLFTVDPSLLLFTCGREAAPFRFNPLIVPKGTDRDTWINLLAEAICSVYFLGEGAVSVIRKGLSHVYAHHPHPKILHLKQWLEQLERGQRRESDWLASTKRAIEAMCFGALGDVLNSDSPIDLERLLDKRVVLELDNFNDDDRTFIVQCVMRWVYRHALENFPRNECKYVLMVDEAHHVFLKRAADMQGKETYSDAILRMVRECSVGFVIADQHPSLISLPALGNTFTTIGMNLKTRADCLAIGNAMLLTEEQRDYLGKLPVGAAIVKLQDRYTEPFVVQIPQVGLTNGLVNEDAIRLKMAAVYPDLCTDSGVSTAPAPDVRREPEYPVSEESVSPPSAEIAKPAEHGTPDLSEVEHAFLVSVLEHPFKGANSRYRDLQISTRNGNGARDSLVAKGYLKPVEVHIHQNKMLLFELTDKANGHLNAAGAQVRHDRSEGGIEHRFGRWYVARWLREHGYNVAFEVATKTGKYVDAVASKDGLSIAIEIETGKSDIKANIDNALTAGYPFVYIVATNPDAFQLVRRAVESARRNPVQKVKACYLLPPVQVHQVDDAR